jgi:hypothetical protein
MRIIITENQLKRVILNEGTKQVVITDEKLKKASSLVNKLSARGFNLSDSAAIVGNMWSETGLNSDAESSNGAIGLLQWLGDRKKTLISYAKHHGVNWSDENTQLDFIKVELKNGYKLENGKFIPNIPKDIKSSHKYEITMFNNAMKQDTIRGKAEKFATLVERCGNCDGTLNIRKESAKRIHDYMVGKYKPSKSASTTTTSSKSKTKGYSVGDVIYPKDSDGYANVRKEPNRDSDRIIKITVPNKIGTISQIKTDTNGNKWYKVTLTKKVDGYSSGWVKSDVVK